MSNTPDDLSEKKHVFLETHPCSAMTQSQKNLNKVARDLFVWNLIQNISIALRLLYKDSWHLERYSQWVVFQKYVVSFIWGHQIKPHTYINMCLLESRGLRCQKQTKNTFSHIRAWNEYQRHRTWLKSVAWTFIGLVDCCGFNGS